MLALFESATTPSPPSSSAQVWPFPAEWRWPQSIAGRAMDTYHRWMEVVIYATFAGLPCMATCRGRSFGVRTACRWACS